MSTFKFDEVSWENIDQVLFKPVDETDNTGVMNPWNYCFNALRAANGGPKAWDTMLHYCDGVIRNVLKQEANCTRNRLEFSKIPEQLVAGKLFKVSDHFIGVDNNTPGYYGIVFPSQREGWLTVKLLGGNVFSKKGVQEGEIPGIGFTHKGGWIGDVKSLDDIEKIL